MDPLDRLEKGVRFGCGAVFGLVAGGVSVLLATWLPVPWKWVGVGMAAAGCGLMAVRFGDDFWRGALRSDWLRWW